MQGFRLDLLMVRIRTYVMFPELAYDDEIVYLGQSRSISVRWIKGSYCLSLLGNPTQEYKHCEKLKDI